MDTATVNSMPPYLARIDIFPIKSLDGLSVHQAKVLASGALQGDRTYALLNTGGTVIHGKSNPAVHRLRTQFSPDQSHVIWTTDYLSTPVSFALQPPRQALEDWLSDYFSEPVRLAENQERGFPDDTLASGPTVISTATLETVASWYGNLTLEEVRRRFRTNLEIGGVPPFWEDQLFSPGAEPLRFTIGAVALEGINPCQRCVVPTRDSLTGQPTPGFQTTFVNHRSASLPGWTHPSRFNHVYRLGVNTTIKEQANQVLTVGDTLQINPL